LPPEDGSYVGILFRNSDKMAIAVNGELNNIAQWKAEFETHAGKKVRVEIHNRKIEIMKK
jgi:hypothetical protein